MTWAAVERIAQTLLYEGYVLFPYSAASLKNRVRMSFGELVVAGEVGRTCQTSETLVEPCPGCMLFARVAFLQPVRRRLFDAAGREVRTLEAAGRRVDAWHEAREVVACVGPIVWEEIAAGPVVVPIHAAPVDEREVLIGVDGAIHRAAAALTAELVLSARGPILSCALRNATTGATGELAALHSAHVATRIEHGAFASVIDPPMHLRAAAEQCASDGAWPVLIGDPSLVLHSPIILNDYPELAPESPHDLFDATENDELLTLSILALSDAERAAMAAVDPRAAALLERVAARPELHGAIRSRRVQVGERFVGVGDGVRLRPNGRDALDGVLAGARATIVELVVDVGGKAQAVVVLDDDPGKDLGLAGLGVGHRMFVDLQELEP